MEAQSVEEPKSKKCRINIFFEETEINFSHQSPIIHIRIVVKVKLDFVPQFNNQR